MEESKAFNNIHNISITKESVDDEVKVQISTTPPPLKDNNTQDTNTNTNIDTLITIDKTQLHLEHIDTKEEEKKDTTPKGSNSESKATEKKEESSTKENEGSGKDKDKEKDKDKPEGKKKQKMIITGDDILIEYVNRIIKHLENIVSVFQKKYNQKIDQVEDILPQSLRNTLERFAMHSIWSNKLNTS
jgi:hypothetical protein